MPLFYPQSARRQAGSGSRSKLRKRQAAKEYLLCGNPIPDKPVRGFHIPDECGGGSAGLLFDVAIQFDTVAITNCLIYTMVCMRELLLKPEASRDRW
jgi:hypothetical protein